MLCESDQAGRESLLALDLKKRSNLGIRARQRVGEHFALGTMMDAHQELYDEVVRKR